MAETELVKNHFEFDSDLLLAREVTRWLSDLLGLNSYDQTAMGTAVSELVRNALKFAGSGNIRYFVDSDPIPALFCIEISDTGPGIADPDLLLETLDRRPGSSGLISARRCVDRFVIKSDVGKGTQILLGKKLSLDIDDQSLDAIRKRMTIKKPESLVEELQLQNQKLINVLDNLYQKQKELTDLQADLVHSNELLRQTNIALNEQAVRDPLTGLYNRLEFNRILETETARSIRYDLPLSLILFDIDFFKSINDTYGHAAGDSILVEMADLVTLNIRQGDFLFRWGGEEFTIIAPHSDCGEAATLAEKIRKIIEQYRFSIMKTVTCSFGVTQFSREESIKTFFKKADKAMYIAKTGGRNRVEIR